MSATPIAAVPARTAASTASRPSCRVTSIGASGCSAANAATRRATWPIARVDVVATVRVGSDTVPTGRPMSSIAVTVSSTVRASRTTLEPSAVRPTVRPSRTNSSAPSSCSSAFRARDSADWAT
ncbi:hypothetical protein B4N89_07685 [Embleya scabrispora]|uniref:Uncharacterized protein n=1 Tax=Embleya scabrispora TaxID=159449 RepID=A0A1T3NVG1_9ACTN|nr:hypothetical protein B4N89_07685 [Embleya scabrispora]